MSLVGTLRYRLSGRRLARDFRRWRTRDRAWVGRLVSRLGTVHVEGCRFRVDSPLISDELKCRLFYGRYERTERELLRRHLSSTLPVVELGGGMGVVACIVNSRLQDKKKHVVVEANPRMLPLIETNRAMNQARFELVHCAIAYDRTHVSLDSGEDLLASRTQSDSGGDVPVSQLHQILASRQFMASTLICDIEGAEIDLVERELETLSSRVATIIIEEHPEYCSAALRLEMFTRLTQAGFESIDSLRKVHVFRNTRLRGSA